MPSDRDTRIEHICHEALDRDASARHAFLDEACGDDPALRRDVESLLAHAATADEFLARPALDVAAQHAAAAHSRCLRSGQSTRRVHDRGPARRRRHGRGLPRARHEAGPRRRHQGAARDASPRDADRLARFEREARMLAALNHPHIGAIYGLEESDGVPRSCWSSSTATTLAERIAEGPLPLPESARHRPPDRRSARSGARQRHRPPRSQAGQHQDHADGVVKVLDFGLAKASAATSRPRASRTSTDADDRHAARAHHSRHRGLHEPRAGARTAASTSAPTSGRSAASSTRCSRAPRIRARPGVRHARRRFCATSPTGRRCPRPCLAQS